VGRSENRCGETQGSFNKARGSKRNWRGNAELLSSLLYKEERYSCQQLDLGCSESVQIGDGREISVLHRVISTAKISFRGTCAASWLIDIHAPLTIVFGMSFLALLEMPQRGPLSYRIISNPGNSRSVLRPSSMLSRQGDPRVKTTTPPMLHKESLLRKPLLTGLIGLSRLTDDRISRLLTI
jgi:hypothetical protein